MECRRDNCFFFQFHINQHTGAKPYKCPFCDKAFASSGNCYSHRSRMHPGRRIETKITRGLRKKRDQSIATKLKVLSSPVKTSIMTAKGAAYRYQCSMCEHTFNRRDNLTVSFLYQHLILYIIHFRTISSYWACPVPDYNAKNLYKYFIKLN